VKESESFGWFDLFVCGDRMLFVMFTNGSRFKALRMDEDSRFVLDIAVLEVATGFLFFCVKNIMQGEFGTIFAGQYTQKTQASVRQQIPKYVMAATGGFFFRNIDIL